MNWNTPPGTAQHLAQLERQEEEIEKAEKLAIDMFEDPDKRGMVIAKSKAYWDPDSNFVENVISGFAQYLIEEKQI